MKWNILDKGLAIIDVNLIKEKKDMLRGFMKKNNIPYYPLLNNYDKVESIFGSDFLCKSESDILTPEDFLIANDILSRKIYGDTIATFIKEQQTDKLDQLYYNLLSTMPNRNLLNEINLDDIGMVLIRPETY